MANAEYGAPQWPELPGEAPPGFVQDEFVAACKTFAAAAGLGWDALHPRALVRLSDATLRWLMRVLTHCETASVWPQCVGLCVMVLLPKPGGGHRPIGLLPCLVRV